MAIKDSGFFFYIVRITTSKQVPKFQSLWTCFVGSKFQLYKISIDFCSLTLQVPYENPKITVLNLDVFHMEKSAINRRLIKVVK